MNVLVYGAGPQGSYIAYWLKDAGVNVTILARGRRLEYINRYGIMLEKIGSDKRTSRKVETMERLYPEDSFDLVIVAVGKNYYSGVLPYLSANIMTPNILFIGNNAAGPFEQIRLLGSDRILLGFLDLCGIMKGRITQYKSSENPILHFGELNGSESERVKWIKELFEGAGLTVNVSTNIEGWLKHHAALIIPIAGAYQRAGGDLEKMNRNDEILHLMVNTIRETVLVLKNKGYTNVSESIRRLEWVPQPLLTMYARRLLNNKEFDYIFLNNEAMKPELNLLTKELAEIMLESDTPSFDETYRLFCLE